MTTIVPVDAANSSSGTGGVVPIGKEITVFTRAMSGGNLAITTVREANQNVVGVASTFIPGAASGVTQYLNLSDAKSDLGVPMTAAAGTPAGTVGISRTAGTSTQLVGEATSSSTKTDKALFELNLPFTYNAGTPINFVVNAQVAGTGTFTASTTIITPTLYTETTAGVEAVAVTGAALVPTTQQIGATASDLVFTSAGLGLVPGQHLVLELVMAVVTTSGANTGTIDSVRMNFQQATSAAPGTHYLRLTDAKSDLGVPMTAAAGTPSGTVGISRTAGTSMQLVTESSADNTKTDKAVFEFNLPDTYQAGQNINLYVNCSLSSTGSLTSATLTPTLYTETAQGLEAALTPTPASATTASLSAADMAFVLPGQNLVPGQHVLLELVFVVITTGGGVVGNINSVRYVC